MKSTKELAKELGLLKQKQKVVKDHDKAEGITQLFSYLIVLDFESTCWQNDKFRSQEIIEFPAVLLNLRSGEVEAEFHSYVQPQENPILSQFCTQLTGISQSQVDDGIPLFICLKKFSTWLTQQATMRKFSFPPRVTDSNACFVTWSDWDLSVCLHYECLRKQLRRPPEMDYWIDLRASYKKFYNRRPNGLKGALQEVGIIFEGREHSGLHDSRNTAMLVKKMIVDGCRLQVTKSIQSNVNVTSLNGELWKASRASSIKSIPQKTIKESEEINNCKQQCSSDDIIHKGLGNSDQMWLCENIDDSDILSCEEPRTGGESQQTSKCSSPSNEFKESLRKVIKSGTSLKETFLRVPCHDNAASNNVSPVPLINKHRTVRERSNFTSSFENKELDKENMAYVMNRIPKRSNCEVNRRVPLLAINGNMSLCCHHLQTDSNKVQLTSTNTLTVCRSSEKNFPGTGLDSKNPDKNHSKPEQICVSTSFTTPIATRYSRSLQQSNTSFNSKLGFNSPSNTYSFPADLICRTPPLCGCGCRTKRKHVRNGGPNHGRTFFTCQKAGCQFFQWEFIEQRQAANVSALQILPTFDITSSYINSR